MCLAAHQKQKRIGDNGGQAAPRIEWQFRKTQLGNPASAWLTWTAYSGQDVYQAGSGIGPWDVLASSGSLSEPYDLLEIRLIVIAQTALLNGPTVDYLNDIYLTVAAITRGA